MNLEVLFTIVNTAVLPFWLLIVVAPGWIWTGRLAYSALVPALLGSVYVAGVLVGPAPPEGASMTTLDGVAKLFTAREAVLVGWIHYLVFDLFVGAWIARDGLRREIHRLAVAPCILLTLMMGPAGLLAYLILRGALRRTASLVEEGVGAASAGQEALG